MFQLLAEIFLDFLMNREDYLRPLRTLLREIVRAVKQDMNFNAFTFALMKENVDPKFRDCDSLLKVSCCRMHFCSLVDERQHNITHVFILTCFSSSLVFVTLFHSSNV